MEKLKELHDKLLADKAEDYVHETDTCPFCNPDLSNKDSDERGEPMKTFTEDEKDEAVKAAVEAAVAEALTPVLDELNTLKTAKADEEIDARITEAKEEAAQAVTQAQIEKDQAVSTATEAEERYNTLTAYLEKVKTDAEEAAALDARKDERLALIKETASFKEDYITENADRWVAMSDEAFDTMIETLKEGSVKPSGSSDLTETAMFSLRKDGEARSKTTGIIKQIAEAKKQGVNIHNLNK